MAKRKTVSKVLYSIGEVAEITKIPPHRIRYYESKGLISPPRRIGNRRYYTKEHIKELHELKYRLEGRRNGNFQKAIVREVLKGLGEILGEIEKLVRDNAEGAGFEPARGGKTPR